MANFERDSQLPAYELIHRSRTESQPLQVPCESDDGLDKPTSKLPPKPLPGRRKYRRFIIVTLITLVTVIPLAMLIYMIRSMLPDAQWVGLELTGGSCDLIFTPNSSRLQSAFQINLRGEAHLSFAEAKFADLFFDLLVGQGGRLLLGAVSYLVFMDALLRSMEITPVSYKLYASLVFSPNSLLATWHSIKAVSTTKGWRAKSYLIWCALAMVYVLAFPTLIESATGYVSPSSAGFNMANGTVIMADSDKLTSCLNVTDGLAIGLEANHTVVNGPPIHVFDIFRQGYGRPIDYPGENRSSAFWQLVNADWSLIYTATNTSTPSWRHHGSNESTAADSYDYYYTTNITINGSRHVLRYDSTYDLYSRGYCYDGDPIDEDQLTNEPFCVAKSYWVWGFSSIILYIILGLQIIWTIGMYCVWLDANIASELVKTGRTIRGPFRAAADLVEAMNETLGHEYCVYTDQEIARELERSGEKLKYYSSLVDDNELLHIGLTTEPSARLFLSRKQPYGSEDTAKRR